MSVFQAASNPTPPPFPPSSFAPAGPTQPTFASGLAAWLDGCEEELIHPSTVEDRLHRAGWPMPAAQAAAEKYRRRFNEHPLGYSGLLVTTGLAALGAGTAGHLLTAGLVRPVDRNALAGWLAVFLCAAPFAVWSHVWARRVDRTDPVAAWSRPRRGLALTLLWAASVIGVARLLVYGVQLTGVIVGASWAANSSLAEGAINVMIVFAIALPLALWSYRFLHRLDADDPRRPLDQRRRGGGR